MDGRQQYFPVYGLMRLVSRSNATTLGSFSTTPLPFTYTRILAVPKSIPISKATMITPFKNSPCILLKIAYIVYYKRFFYFFKLFFCKSYIFHEFSSSAYAAWSMMAHSTRFLCNSQPISYGLLISWWQWYALAAQPPLQ